MNNKLQISILISFLSLFYVNCVFAQERKIEKAAKEYENYYYINAAEIYENVLSSGYVSEEILQKVANTYYFNANYTLAEKYYTQLIELSKNLPPVYYLRYAQSLRAIGEDKKATKWYKRFNKESGIKETFFSTQDYLDLIEKNSGRYKIKNLDINSDGIDFGGAIYQDQLVYSSTKDTGVFMKRKSGWDGLSFLDFFSATIQSTDSLTVDNIIDGKKLKGKVNSKYHESTACFTEDGKTMYFTRNNLTPDQISKKEAQKLKIYRATQKDGEWKAIEDLSINSDFYSSAHPALSPMEDTLYFASDRPGGVGETDIYYVSIDKNGNLGAPKNLGDKINTPGRETFPFVSKANELFFASDGHFGLGGLDIFYVSLNKKGTGDLLNVGKPINSSHDDFAYYINTETNKGFFSSNRGGVGTHGYDDIYSFVEKEKIKDLLKAIIYGKVIDKDTRKPITNASMTLLNLDNEVEQTTTTDSVGNYQFEAKRYQEYSVRAAKETYDTDEKLVETKEEKTEANFELKRNQMPLEPGQDLAKVLNIPIIYFDFDKSNIRQDASIELEKLVAVLNKYPTMKIDIRSHTDSRGSDSYNEALSERRAQSTLKYIVKRGIDEARLSAKGYGENQLVNECSNDVPCSEEAHQLNRRSQFIIVEI